MIALALLASLIVQDTNTTVSPRVRAMLDRFPLPAAGAPSIVTRFSRDSVWVGEQVELVTVTFFPRLLRNRLRHLPGITPPSLSGLWSARSQQLPIPIGTRIVGGQLYDMYVSWQTIFPLGGGRIEAPPSVLTYNLPTSSSYFAPEEQKRVLSGSAVLVVRGVPPAAAATLGVGPTARGLKISWRSPLSTMQAGSPTIVDLAVSGEGNLTLWPAPQIAWPPGIHVYPEPTEELPANAQGLIAGEKRFRFTIVPDNAGVLTLPSVRYPYFDPGSGTVNAISAASLSLPILARATTALARGTFEVTGQPEVPVAALVVRKWFPLLVAIVVMPILLLLVARRRRAVIVPVRPITDPELALRRALRTPVEAGTEHVVTALRSRGIERRDAESVRHWLDLLGRWRYGPGQRPEAPPTPPSVAKVLEQLKIGLPILLLFMAVTRLAAQRTDAVTRFADHDFAGAERAFAAVTAADPLAEGAWRDLGTARWMNHNDVGAAAAWLRAFALAPRDPILRSAWSRASSIPADVRQRAPRVPVSRDELLVAAVISWLVAVLGIWKRWERVAQAAGLAATAALVWFAVRWSSERPGDVLVTVATTMHISPHPATMGVGDLPAWTRLHVARRAPNWVLVIGQIASGATGGGLTVQGWVPLASVAPIGPLD